MRACGICVETIAFEQDVGLGDIDGPQSGTAFPQGPHQRASPFSFTGIGNSVPLHGVDEGIAASDPAVDREVLHAAYSEVFHLGHDRARNIGEQLPSCPLVELADHKLLAGHRVRFAETGRIPVGTAEEPGIEDMGLAIVGARDDHLAAIPMLGKEAAVAIG